MRIGLIDELERSSSKYFTQGDGKRATDFLIEITKVAGGLGAKNLLGIRIKKIQVPSRTKNPLCAATLVQEATMVVGVSSIDLTPELGKTEPLDELYFVQDPHWTRKGQEWIAPKSYRSKLTF